MEEKDSSLRPCIEYRGLNYIIVKNKYPLPLIDSAFGPLHQASIFTKLDLRNAYLLLTHLLVTEYLVMPFGLTNAPAVFQALINDVVQDMVIRFVFAYLDDILIFSHDFKEHVQHVILFLQHLLENRLYI